MDRADWADRADRADRRGGRYPRQGRTDDRAGRVDQQGHRGRQDRYDGGSPGRDDRYGQQDRRGRGDRRDSPSRPSQQDPAVGRPSSREVERDRSVGQGPHRAGRYPDDSGAPAPRPARYAADPRQNIEPRRVENQRPVGRPRHVENLHGEDLYGGRRPDRPEYPYDRPQAPARGDDRYPDQYRADDRLPVPVGYAQEPHPYRDGVPDADRYGEDPYEDPYEDGRYDMSPADPDGSGGRHRRAGGGDGGGKRRWTYYAKRAVAVLGVLVLLAGGYVFYEYKHLDGNINRVDVLQTKDENIRQADKQKNAENFLLIGSDSRANTDGQFGEDVEGARSDTTILAHLSPNHDRAILISIPRDSWVDIPSCVQSNGESTVEQKGQFNSAFALGGPNCTIRTVQKLTGIAVTHYVQVDFNGFQNMVHALGGINMCSTVKAIDPKSGLRLRAGDNLLDGAQALAYVRARYNLGNGGDLDRIQRQQRFLGAMMRKATSGDVLLNPVKLQRFLDAATKSLTMDQNTHIGDLKDLATALHGLDPASVSFITPFIANPAYDPNDPSNPKGGRVLLNDDKNRVLFDSIINDQTSQPTPTPTSAAPKPTKPANTPKITVAPQDVRVYVYNGVGTNGLAGTVRDNLSVLGFTIVNTGNQGSGLATSEVHYGSGHIDAARTLAAAVPGSVLKEDPNYQSSVALIVGGNYDGVQQVKVGDAYKPAGTGAGSAPAHPNGPITPSGAINAADTACGS
ncbi:MAG TPA: LCP family protein [Mycobacteriales bacterium]